MPEIEIYQRLGVALVIGLLVGVERGWQQRGLPEGERVVGIRSFTLIGLLGGLVGLLGGMVGDVVVATAFFGFAILVVVAHWVRAGSNADVGITTEIAELVTFALALMAVRGDMAVASAGAVVTVALLGMKGMLHGWLQRLQELELVAAIKLLLISVVLLPVLPDRGFGPGEVINPYKLWWLVVAIAGLSFVGYFAIKVAGPRLGSLLTGVFGGLASSTALTVSFARLGRASPALQPALAAGVAVAASTMLLRLFVIVAFLNVAMIPRLLWPLGLMAAAGYGGAVLLWWGTSKTRRRDGADLPVQNPIEFGTALKFAAFLAVVLVASELVKQWLGNTGLYLLAAVSGLADVDAISVSMAGMAGRGVGLGVAVTAVVIAAMVNTAVKAGFVAALCGGVMAARTASLVVGMIVAGLAGLWAGG